ncbi:MAG: LysR family transcriptional regulator [Pseudomonadota bacterium]
MELSDLKMLLLVRDLGSFAAAARGLSVNPASVSRRVAEIEADLGLRIFQRSTRRFAVTEAGEAFLARIAPLLDEFDAALGSAETLAVEPGGTLRMTTSVSFGHEVVVPLLGAFRAAHPRIKVELILTDSNVDLVRDRIDLALRLAPAPAGDLISSRLLKTRYHVVASTDYLRRRGHPRVPRDLSQHDTLRFALPGFRDRWLFRDTTGATTEVPVDGWLVISNALSLRHAALDGLGAALLADWLVGRDLHQGALVDLFPAYEVTATDFDAGVWALYPSKAYLPQRVRLMIDFIRRQMG